MLIDHKPSERTKELVSSFMMDIQVLAVEMSKGSVNYDHGTIKSLIETAKIVELLSDIRNEMRAMNQREAIKDMPMSMFNQRT